MPDPLPTAEVAVVLITDRDGRHLLADFNPAWGGFTLPMTGCHAPAAPPGGATAPEPPAAAATRAAAEVLGRPLPPGGLPTPLAVEVPPYQQSGRDGQWKRYKFHLFALRADADPHPLPGHAAVWLPPAAFETHAPVSPTAVHVLKAVAFADVRAAVGLGR